MNNPVFAMLKKALNYKQPLFYKGCGWLTRSQPVSDIIEFWVLCAEK